MAVILTDGDAADIAEFNMTVTHLPPDVYVVVGVVGFGDEYESALASFSQVAAFQPRLRVVTLGGPGANPRSISESLIGMLSHPVSASAWM